jgi:hypothetical protein
MTPYEQFLRQNLETEKQKAQSLAEAYSKAKGLRKIALKRDLDQISQNVQILSRDLEKYVQGLHWLREPTKERDEKAEHLKPVPADVFGPVTPKAQAAPPKPGTAPAATTRPQIGTPVGGARPAVSQPRLAAPAPPPTSEPAPSTAAQAAPQASPATPSGTGRPRIGSPVRTPVQGAPTAQEPAQPQPAQSQPQAAPAQRPTIGTPVGGRPRIGTPVGQTQQAPPAPPEPAPAESAQAEQAPPKTKRPVIGTPIAGRPRIGTPIGQAQSESTSQDTNSSENSESSS